MDFGNFRESVRPAFEFATDLGVTKFKNCDIERWKSFAVKGGDFAYSDILQRAVGEW